MSSASKGGRSTAEREHTDQSLRVERREADAVLDERVAAIDDAADRVIERARARADDVLAAERARVDRAASRQDPTSEVATRRERVLADRLVEHEREVADEVVRADRAAVAAVLATGRGQTDRDLSKERSSADDAVGTRDEFLGVVSHDLRNMLSSVIGFAELIAKAQTGETAHAPEDVLTYARRIERSGHRMNRLVGDLVDVASIEAGVLAVAPREADAREVVAEAVDNFQEHAASKGVSLVADLAGASFGGTFDAARILQVLANLVGNAVKFTPRGGTVRVSVERVDHGLSFAVRDSGIGIPPEQLEAVFERYRQLGHHDRRGVGLGLYISKCIVQGHGGRIWAESGSAGGSTFRFTLPSVGA